MNHWQPVAHISELAKPGDFILLPWVDGELAVTNIAGKIIAFDNRCPHRGARIFTEPRGNREPRCAYHGRLASADGVNRFHVEQNSEWIGIVDEIAPHISLKTWSLLRATPPLTYHSTLSFTMDCHWTVAVENALDLEHVGHVHGESLAKLGLVRKDLVQLWEGSSIETFRSEAGLGKLSKFFSHEQAFDYLHVHLFPYSCISSTRGWTYSLQHYIPRADGKTTFIHRLYTAPTTRPMPEFFNSVARLNEKVFREDAAICAGIPRDFPGALGPRDDRIKHFRSHL